MSNTDKIFDGLLVLQYRSGHKEAFRLLVARHHKKLCKHAYWYTHDIDVAQDVAQECWGVIVTKLHTLKNPNVFGSWALRIVTRKALNYLKKEQREMRKRSEFQWSHTKEEDHEIQEAMIRKLGKAMSELTVDQRQVLHLFYKEALSLREISTILDISEGTVKSRMFHARERLKLLMK